MKVSWEMPRTAGIESTAKTKSVISMQMRHSSRGVAFLAPSTFRLGGPEAREASDRGSNSAIFEHQLLAFNGEMRRAKRATFQLQFQGLPKLAVEIFKMHVGRKMRRII